MKRPQILRCITAAMCFVHFCTLNTWGRSVSFYLLSFCIVLSLQALDAGAVNDVLGHHARGARFHLGHMRAD